MAQNENLTSFSQSGTFQLRGPIPLIPFFGGPNFY